VHIFIAGSFCTVTDLVILLLFSVVIRNVLAVVNPVYYLCMTLWNTADQVWEEAFIGGSWLQESPTAPRACRTWDCSPQRGS